MRPDFHRTALPELVVAVFRDCRGIRLPLHIAINAGTNPISRIYFALLRRCCGKGVTPKASECFVTLSPLRASLSWSRAVQNEIVKPLERFAIPCLCFVASSKRIHVGCLILDWQSIMRSVGFHSATLVILQGLVELQSGGIVSSFRCPELF